MATLLDADTSGWRFAQCFGDKGEVEDVTEADIISTVEFDHTGNYLATGDKGGRVVLFERHESKKQTCEYKFYTEFQSHEPEFDYLKSLEIEEKINKIRWCRRQNQAHFLLSTNDKTIKLWKVFEKSLRVVAENNLSASSLSSGSLNTSDFHPSPLQQTTTSSGFSSTSGPFSPNNGLQSPHLRLPRMAFHDNIVAAVPRKVYANAHAYHINSISINSDGETYLSADDLRINLWNLNISDQSFNILDIKPLNMEELTEVITAAEFHPSSCNLFCYSSSKGTVKLADMRDSALCDRHAKLYEEEEDPSNKSFFSEIISSVSDVKFSRDGRYILSRDYLTLRIWDVNMDSKPLKTINVHDHLRPKLCDLYENDCIFDKFECTWSGDGEQILSGSYNNNFHIYDRNAETDVVLQADKSAFKAKKVGAQKAKGGLTGMNGKGMQGKPANGTGTPVDVDNIDFNKKILHASWHPKEDTIAIAATNNLFLFAKSSGAGSPLVPNSVTGSGGGTFSSSFIKELTATDFKKAVLGTDVGVHQYREKKQLKPEYEKAAKNLAGLVEFVSVNCDEDKNKPLCQEYGVRGFPTVKMFGGVSKAKPSDYNGQRTASGLVQQALREMPTFSKRIRSASELEKLVSRVPKKPVVFLLTDRTATPTLFKAVSADFHKQFSFYTIKDDEEFGDIKETFSIRKVPTLLLWKGSESVEIYGGELKIGHIAHWLKQAGKASGRKAEL
ncbi:MAG: protein phosphatase 2A regulatory subunit cdc55 [Cyphobasidiales sp. Tagirdzhanova-0007]|nr:MAG: protein phosphatase 2A regulatory subunit cdc55 [Cyphobasidiales sp. Tagirdzhanova-0007]